MRYIPNKVLFASVAFSFFTTGVVAQTIGSSRDLKLLPAPREVKIGTGQFVLSPQTPIILEVNHRDDDQVATETLIHEIHDRLGYQPAVQFGPVLDMSVGTHAIFLWHLDDPRVQELLKSHGLELGKDSDPQGYLLYADARGVIVAGQTSQGLFYGVQTLRQLLHSASQGLVCPSVAIKDWPAMTWRGIQDDVSRGPIPTPEYMKKQIRVMAGYKINLFALYMEHVFDYRSQPLLAPRDAGITAEQLNELTVFAKKYFVTILPEQQTFGHFHHVLKKEIYADVAEKPHGQALTPVNAKTYELIASMYAELAPLTPGPFFHIGTDEVFDLGTGKSKSHTEAIGAGAVYGDHLIRVEQLLEPYHKRLIFWGDIAEDYPEQLSRLPKSMIAMPWNYSARDSFDDIIEPFVAARTDFMVATGASTWEMIWPDLDVAFVNIRNFVRDGQKAGALGVLNTTWNDDGEGLLDSAWLAFVFGAAAGWQSGESSIEDFKQSYDWAFYRNEGSQFRDAIDQLNNINHLFHTVGISGSQNDLFWANPFSPRGAAALGKALPVAHDVRIAAESGLANLYVNRNLAVANGETLDAMAFAAERLDVLGMQIQFAAEMNAAYWDSFKNAADRERVLNNFDEITGTNARLEDLRDAATYLRGLEEKEWARQYAPYWHRNVVLRYDRMAMAYESQIELVREAIDVYRAKQTLPQPEQLGFYIQP